MIFGQNPVIKKQIAIVFFIAVCGVAQAFSVSDDFSLRGAITNGTRLSGQAVQNGSGVYSNTGAVHLEFGTVSGHAAARIIPGSSNGGATFSLPGLPASGTIRMIANVLIPATNIYSGAVPGIFIGFTSKDNNLMNNIGTNADHVTLRYVPSAGSAGRIELQSNVGATQSNLFSVLGAALPVVAGREYEMRLDYDFATDLVTGTVKDLTTLGSITHSMTISDGIALSRVQMDFTGVSTAATSAQVSGFNSMSVSGEGGVKLSLFMISCLTPPR